MNVTFTDREADLMEMLWEHGPSTVAEVRARLKAKLAYNTVLTILRTLEAKGCIAHLEEGRAHRYMPLVTRDVARRSALRHLASKLFKGSTEVLLTHLVSDQKLTRFRNQTNPPATQSTLAKGADVIASMMMYGATVAAIIALAALAIEHSCTMLKCPRRLVWLLALVLSVSLPIVSILTKQERPAPHALVENVNYVAPVIVADNHSIFIGTISSAIQQPSWPERPNLDRVLKALWFVSSLGALAFYGMEWAKLRHAARKWTHEAVDGHAVLVADQLGPAVVGFLKPDIVLPRWLLAAPSPTRAMILAHERAHIAARDPLMVLTALILVALAPWNVALLWQFRRLRFAIEVDCDARVLREGDVPSPSVYGEILLAVGVHNSRTPKLATALTAPASQLEQRIRTMVSEAPRHSKPIAIAGAVVSLILVLGSTQMNSPATASQVTQTPSSIATTPDETARLRAEQEAPQQLVPFDPIHFDKYVGYYELRPGVIFKITREGDKFYAQLTGQGPVEQYPESETKFFATVVAAQISFVVDEKGKATELILHQSGREQIAKKIDETTAKSMEVALADRIRRNTPAPGTEAFLRRYIASQEAGKPDYSEMAPALESAARQQQGRLTNDIAKWGPLVSIEFSRVNQNGADVYILSFKNVRIPTTVFPVGPDGKVSGLLFQPPPVLAKVPNAAVVQRIKDNKPSPGTEAYLRNYLISASKGQPDYSGMDAGLEASARGQWPTRGPVILARGALKSLTFMRVSPEGYDVYDAVYEHSELEWSVAPLGSDGKESYAAGFALPGSK